MTIEKNLRTKLLKITWPIFVELTLFSLLGAMDIFMLGRYSDEAVAAIGITNQIIWTVYMMFGVITAGTTVLVSQYIGAKNKNIENIQVCGLSMGINTILGLIISILMVFCGTYLFKLLNTPQELIDLGSGYMKIIGASVFVQAILMTLTAILRAHGKTKICMKATIAMNIVNVVGNYILIFGIFNFEGWGVDGAAIATTTSRVVAMIILWIAAHKLILKDFNLDMLKPFPVEQIKNVLKIGLPTAGEQFSYMISQIMVTGFINIISISSMSTRMYIGNITMVTVMFSSALAQGASVYIGMLIGEGQNDKAHSLCIYCIKKALIVTTSIALLVGIFGGFLVNIFTNSEEIIALGSLILLVEIILQPGKAINLIGINGLRATGDIKFPVYIGIFSTWTFAVILAYVLAITLNMGLLGIWISFTIDEWFRAILVLIRWKSKAWEGKSFVKENQNDLLVDQALG
ncbi:MAG: MATE family efflux transporter [Sarcina sp.]